MKEHNKINIKNIQTNFNNFKGKKTLPTGGFRSSISTEKIMLTDRNIPNNKIIIKKDIDNISSKPVNTDIKSRGNSNSRALTSNSNIPISFNLTNFNFPKKPFPQSPIQEIHNNVYNFYSASSNHDNNIFKKNKEDVEYNHPTATLNEKNEYIKYLLSENQSLKNKLYEKMQENNQLRSKYKETKDINGLINIKMSPKKFKLTNQERKLFIY